MYDDAHAERLTAKRTFAAQCRIEQLNDLEDGRKAEGAIPLEEVLSEERGIRDFVMGYGP